jgi:hypothetical protein
MLMTWTKCPTTEVWQNITLEMNDSKKSSNQLFWWYGITIKVLVTIGRSHN